LTRRDVFFLNNTMVWVMGGPGQSIRSSAQFATNLPHRKASSLTPTYRSSCPAPHLGVVLRPYACAPPRAARPPLPLSVVGSTHAFVGALNTPFPYWTAISFTAGNGRPAAQLSRGDRVRTQKRRSDTERGRRTKNGEPEHDRRCYTHSTTYHCKISIYATARPLLLRCTYSRDVGYDVLR